jgi:hypothetical protein
MAETSADRAAAVQTIAPVVQSLDTPAQVAAMNAVIPGPGEKTVGILWLILVGGLVGLAGVALVGLIVLLATGNGTDVVLTAFTALLTGLIGLFSPSPVTKSGQITPTGSQAT